MFYWRSDEVMTYMYDVGLNCLLIKVLLMYVVDYSCHVDAWSKWYACGLLVSLIRMCEVMGLHMHVELQGLDLDYE